MMKVEMLKTMARGRWGLILQQLAPGLREALDVAGTKRKVTCPMPHHGGKGDFRMFADWQDTGGAICSCGAYSDGFSLLQAMNGWEFKVTCEEVERYLTGHVSTLSAKPQPKPAKQVEADDLRKKEQDARRMANIRNAWENAFPLEDKGAEPAWRYLVSRGLSPRLAAQYKALRCHPALPYFDQDNKCQGAFPALLAAFYNPEGKAITLHRIYLDPSGGKLPVPDAKKPFPLPSCHTMTGGAIRLGKPGRLLGVTEGVETALAVSLATNQTVWPLYSANGMASFIPPEGVEEVWIWADHDVSQAGWKHAKILKQRLWARRVTARIMLPAMVIPPGMKGVDWLNVLGEQGVIGFPAAQRMMPLRLMPEKAAAAAQAAKEVK